MDHKPAVNYPSQLAILLGLMGIFMIVSALLVAMIGAAAMHVPPMKVALEMNRPEYVNLSRFLNTLASLFVFMVPSLILARILSKRPFAQLRFNTQISGRQALLVLFLSLASIIMGGALGALNEWIPIPATWYAKAKAMEEIYKETMLAMATMKTTSDYLISLLVIAALPAFFEEIFFRGALQQVFVGMTRSRWVGIFITSVLFSAIHFSYFGFLPRLALGIVLGLIFSYSKNIWLSVLLHFLNNALIVTQLFIMSRQGKPIEKTMDENAPVWWGVIAIVLIVTLFRAFRKESEKVAASKQMAEIDSAENIIS